MCCKKGFICSFPEGVFLGIFFAFFFFKITHGNPSTDHDGKPYQQHRESEIVHCSTTL